MSNNCITTVNAVTDKCITKGLNSFGCGALIGQDCYYDDLTQKCVSTALADESEKQRFFNNALCPADYPTRTNCLNIVTIN